MTVKVLRGAAAEQAGRWEIPSIDATAAAELEGAGGRAAHLLTAGQLDALQQRVREEAWQAGFAEGLAGGRAEADRRSQRLGRLLDALSYPFEALDETVEQELATLAIALASRILRREIEHDRSQIARMVKEALAILPVGVRSIVVQLSAEDERYVSEHLPADPARRWRLHVDPALAAGDLRIVTEHSQIDGQLGVRLEALLESIEQLADDRGGAGEPPA